MCFCLKTRNLIIFKVISCMQDFFFSSLNLFILKKKASQNCILTSTCLVLYVCRISLLKKKISAKETPCFPDPKTGTPLDQSLSVQGSHLLGPEKTSSLKLSPGLCSSPQPQPNTQPCSIFQFMSHRQPLSVATTKQIILIF